MSKLILGFWTARVETAPEKNKAPLAAPARTKIIAAIEKIRFVISPSGWA